MDLMMYVPKMEEETRVIAKRIERLGNYGSDRHNGEYEAKGAYAELLGMGKYIVSHLLNAWENPPPEREFLSRKVLYSNLQRLLVEMIERDDFTFEQLQRYRRLITSEKL